MRYRFLVVLATVLAPATLSAQGGDELPSGGEGGNCWKCKWVTFAGGPNETYSIQQCDPGYSSGHATCTSGGQGTTGSCSLGGGACGGPGNDEEMLAQGVLSKNGMASLQPRYSLALLERSQPSPARRLPHTGENGLIVSKNCRGFVTAVANTSAVAEAQLPLVEHTKGGAQ